MFRLAVSCGRALFTIGAVVTGFAREPGCGGVDASSSGVNAPCTRDKDCFKGLSCDQGVCTGWGDAGADEGGSFDAGPFDARAFDAVSDG